MSRQLSSSSTCSRSWPHVLLLRWRIPSSVINSQWDKLNACSLGQCIESCIKVLSVIKTHSSKSIFSSSWQFRAKRVKPASVSWEHLAASKIFSLGQFRPSAVREASVRLQQPETHSDWSLWHPLQIFTIPSSEICVQDCKFRIASSWQWFWMCFNASSSNCISNYIGQRKRNKKL